VGGAEKKAWSKTPFPGNSRLPAPKKNPGFSRQPYHPGPATKVSGPPPKTGSPPPGGGRRCQFSVLNDSFRQPLGWSPPARAQQSWGWVFPPAIPPPTAPPSKQQTQSRGRRKRSPISPSGNVCSKPFFPAESPFGALPGRMSLSEPLPAPAFAQAAAPGPWVKLAFKAGAACIAIEQNRPKSPESAGPLPGGPSWRKAPGAPARNHQTLTANTVAGPLPRDAPRYNLSKLNRTPERMNARDGRSVLTLLLRGQNPPFRRPGEARPVRMPRPGVRPSVFGDRKPALALPVCPPETFEPPSSPPVKCPPPSAGLL